MIMNLSINGINKLVSAAKLTRTTMSGERPSKIINLTPKLNFQFFINVECVKILFALITRQSLVIPTRRRHTFF